MIIPGPQFNIQREVARDEAGRITRRFWNIQAKGTLVAFKGSPSSAGVFHTGSYSAALDENIADVSRLASLRNKMKALSDLFCAKGQWMEIQPFDGSQSIKFQPRIRNINFAQGLWFDKVEYTIDMEADTVFFGTQEECGGTSDVVPQESWGIEAADQIGRTYRLTHSVSSNQKDLFDAFGNVPSGNNGWERARDIVLGHLGISDVNKIEAPGVLNLTNWGAYNYVRGQQIDESAGRFAVNETWLVYDPRQGGVTLFPPALDDFVVNSRTSDDGIVHVTIDGTVTGLEVRDISSGSFSQSRWDSASLYYSSQISGNVFSRASSYSGVLLNPTQILSSVGRNPINGTISYSYEFSNRRSPTIPGAVREEITLSLSGGTDIFAVIPLPGRPWGPVLQDMETISERTMSINISAQMQSSNMLNPITFAPNTDGIVVALAPVALQVFRSRDEISFADESGKYTRSVLFVYQ